MSLCALQTGLNQAPRCPQPILDPGISEAMWRSCGEKSQKQPCSSLFRFYSKAAQRILCALEITRFASIIPDSNDAT